MQHTDHVWGLSQHEGPQGDQEPNALWCEWTSDAEQTGKKQDRGKSVLEWAPHPLYLTNLIQPGLWRILCCEYQVESIPTLSLDFLSENFVCQSIFYFPILSQALCHLIQSEFFPIMTDLSSWIKGSRKIQAEFSSSMLWSMDTRCLHSPGLRKPQEVSEPTPTLWLGMGSRSVLLTPILIPLALFVLSCFQSLWQSLKIPSGHSTCTVKGGGHSLLSVKWDYLTVSDGLMVVNFHESAA